MSTPQYALYWSGYTSISNVTGANSNSVFYIWEGISFTIQLTRFPVCLGPSRFQWPFADGRSMLSLFDGRLRSVALSFKFNDAEIPEKLIIGGNQGPSFYRGNEQIMLPSHYPKYKIKADSFWEEEYGQKKHPNCTGHIRLYPGCLNFPDKPDDSNVKLHFPVGLPSAPNGFYANGVLSVLLTRFNNVWEPEYDYNSPHQNFVLSILRRRFSYSYHINIIFHYFLISVRYLQLGNLFWL